VSYAGKLPIPPNPPGLMSSTENLHSCHRSCYACSAPAAPVSDLKRSAKMKTTLLVTLALLLTQAAFAVGLPNEMSGSVYGFLSSAKRFTYDYSSHPTLKEIGTILNGSLIIESKVFS